MIDSKKDITKMPGYDKSMKGMRAIWKRSDSYGLVTGLRVVYMTKDGSIVEDYLGKLYYANEDV